MRVDEQRAARLQHARRFFQHRRERLRRQVLEHVERPRLVEGAVRKRQLAQVAEQQVDLAPRFMREEGRDVDADRSRAPRSRFHSSARPLPQPRSTTRSPGAGARKRAQHVVADPRSEQRRRHPLVPRVHVQRLVQVLGLLGERLARAEVEEVGAGSS